MSEELQEVKWYYQVGYKEAKGFIRDNINSAARSFVSVGFYLKHIRDNGMHREDGYSSIWDLAQAEFGISKPQASKFINICERFSVDGNSPVLLEQYRDFTSSKLQEMLYLTNEQLEQVTITTTVAEIREIKNPEKTVSTSKQESESEKTSPEAEPETKAHGLSIDFTRSLDSLAKEFEEKSDCPPGQIDCRRNWDPSGYYDRKKNGPCKDCIGCWKDWLSRERIKAGAVEHEEILAPEKQEPVESHNEAWFVKEYFDRKPSDLKKLVSAYRSAVDNPGLMAKTFQENISKYGAYYSGGPGYAFSFHSFAGGIDLEIGSEKIHMKYGRFVKEALDIYKDILVDDGAKSDNTPFSANDTPEIVDNQPETVNDAEETTAEEATFDFPCDTCGHDIQGCCDYDTKDLYCTMGDAWIPKETDQVETVEADIIQTVPVDPEQYTFQDVEEEHGRLTEYVDTFRKNNDMVPGRRKAKMRLDAITLLANEMQKPAIAEEPEPVQPELPILKNNDQRKEWAENYKAWGEWYYDEHIDCHYYKYDFTNGDRLVVEEYLNRSAYWGHEADRCHYHLLQKNKPAYEKNKTFEQKYVHAESSMTEIVEYLKNLQKKGA